MPTKLKFPEKASGLPKLVSPTGPVVDGIYGRALCQELLSQKGANISACLHALTICTGLYAGFWMQYVVQFVYNSPSLHFLTGGNWAIIPDVRFYFPISDRLGLSLAQIFMLLSGFGVVIAMLYAWHFTRQSSVKWRLRGLVFLFCFLTGGWAFAGWMSEDMAWERLEIWRDRFIEERERWGDTDPHDIYTSRIEEIDELLLKRPR